LQSGWRVSEVPYLLLQLTFSKQYIIIGCDICITGKLFVDSVSYECHKCLLFWLLVENVVSVAGRWSAMNQLMHCH